MLTSGTRRWYVVGAYVLTNDLPAMHHVEQVLKEATKGLEVILMGELNVRLRDPCDECEEDLETALADRGLVSMIYHFMP